VKGGNMSEIEQAYELYVDAVYKFFYIQCFDVDTAEDLTSKTFVAFVEKAHSQEIDNYKKYIYGIMRNVWIAFLREKYNSKVLSIESIEDFESYVEETTEDFEKKDIKERAKSFIDLLPDKQKTVAHMRLIEEKTISEIADMLGKSSSYVKTTQNRAIKNLSKLLANQGDITV
jgi:RNA polymerase sigma-70 factor, ECF subfamily